MTGIVEGERDVGFGVFGSAEVGFVELEVVISGIDGEGLGVFESAVPVAGDGDLGDGESGEGSDDSGDFGVVG